jgi:hypothetical protein
MYNLIARGRIFGSCLAQYKPAKRNDTAFREIRRRVPLWFGWFGWFGWFEDSGSIYIAMEYFVHGDLQQHLAHPVPEADAR